MHYLRLSANENIGKYKAIKMNATNNPIKTIIAGSINESAAAVRMFTSSS
jgi:hypothetical protein